MILKGWRTQLSLFNHRDYRWSPPELEWKNVPDRRCLPHMAAVRTNPAATVMLLKSKCVQKLCYNCPLLSTPPNAIWRKQIKGVDNSPYSSWLNLSVTADHVSQIEGACLSAASPHRLLERDKVWVRKTSTPGSIKKRGGEGMMMICSIIIKRKDKFMIRNMLGNYHKNKIHVLLKTLG